MIGQSKATFKAWTKSEAFRLAHRDAGQNKPLYLVCSTQMSRLCSDAAAIRKFYLVGAGSSLFAPSVTLGD